MYRHKTIYAQDNVLILKQNFGKHIYTRKKVYLF